MKFYVKLVVVIAVIAGVLYWLQRRQEAESIPVAPAASTVPAQTPAPTPLQTPLPPALAAPAFSDPNQNMIAQAAQGARVSVVSIAHQGGYTVVTISAHERNALGEFLDECMKVGMKDVQQVPGAYRQGMDAQGRTTYRTTYKLKF